MREHTVNSQNNFIGGWYMDDTTICDRIIEFHKNDPHVSPGKIGILIKPEAKDSYDTALNNDRDLYLEYTSHVKDVLELYSDKFKPFVQDCHFFGFVEEINVQKYLPGGGFKRWHTERNSGEVPACDRHLVFMTYLNDITDQGETEFYYQQLKVKPEKGLTLMWGVDWTFTHRGIVSPTQEKYITTGWLSFIKEKL